MGSNLLRKLYNRSVELRTDLNSVTVPKCLETQKQNRQRAGKLSRIEIVKSSSRWNPWSGIDWDSSNSNSSSRQFDKSQHPGKINIEDGKRRMKQSAARHLVIYLTNIYSPSVVHISTKTTKMLLLMVLLLLGKWTFFGKDHTHRHTVRSVVLRAQAGTCTQAHTHTLFLGSFNGTHSQQCFDVLRKFDYLSPLLLSFYGSALSPPPLPCPKDAQHWYYCCLQ